MDYKLLFTDFDGTLVGRDLKISQGNLEAMKKAQENGLKIMICTGRSYLKLKQFEDTIGISGRNLYGVAFNGAVVYEVDTRKLVFDKRLDRNLALKIIERLKTKNVPILVYVLDKLYAENDRDQYSRNYKNSASIELEIVNDFKDIKEDFSKILVINENLVLQEVYLDLKDEVEGECNMFFSSENLLEFTNLEVSKGNSVEFICKKMNIDRSQVIAIGDNYNDISMIKYAGLGVAVNNSVDELKNLSDYVTKNDNKNSALKEIIDKFVLI